MTRVLREVNKDKRYYDTEYSTEFPAGHYYVETYGYLPSFAESDLRYKADAVGYFKERFQLIWDSKTVKQKQLVSKSEVYEDPTSKLVIHITYKYEPSKNGRMILRNLHSIEEDYDKKLTVPEYVSILYYYVDQSSVQTIVEDIAQYIVQTTSKSKISLVTSTRAGLDTIEQDIKPVDIDLDMNYGSKFLPVHNKILDRLSEDNGKGIVLLHGVPGTGKTNYIRHLCGKIENKEIIFLPPFLAENISSPDFIPFVLEHRNSILVIEDAEKIVLDREGASSSRQSVANLLNMTDGLLSDCLSIQIIATFNTSREMIDKALLRKGRLIAEWKFDKLSVEDTNKLIRSLGREDVATSPMSLADIYNADEEEYVVQKERGAIGFAR